MRIPAITYSNIQRLSNPVKSPGFGSNECFYIETIDAFVSNKIKTNTYALREDLYWDNLARQMNVTFRNKEKVNVFSLACSDGSEPYSLAIALVEELGMLKTKPDKFFPILASDKRAELIEKNKKGLWNLKKGDLRRFEGYGYYPFSYVEESKEKLKLLNDQIGDETVTYKVKNKLREKVKFSRATIQDRLNMIDDDSNTVILCRNVLPYLNDERKVFEVAELASKKLKEGSLFVIGFYDCQTGIEEYLSKLGFKCISDDGYVYQKKHQATAVNNHK